jgi:hypothetical protein
MPQITKPTNTLCKHCQQGKQTKTRFKSKEYSTTRPLEIVHNDLVGPISIRSHSWIAAGAEPDAHQFYVTIGL